MGDFYLQAYQWIAKHKLVSAIGLFLIVIGLTSIGSQIKFEDDITSLIPANDETKRIQKALKSITFTDKIIVTIQKGQHGTVEDLTDYATELLDSLEKNQSEFIKNIQGRVNEDDIPNTLNLIYENLPLFLDPNDYNKISAKLAKDSIAKSTAENYRTLISPSGIIAKKIILKDPLGLSFIALKKLQQLGIGEDFKLKNGYLIDVNENHLLLFITPTHGSNETDKNLPFSEEFYSLQDELNQKYKQRSQSEYYGAALVAVANAKQIRTDIQFTVSIAMTLLILLLIFFYRKLTLPLILFAPTIFGVLLSVAFLCLWREKISAISLGIGSILLGVTLDYALHILTHIRNGKSIESLYREVAPSIMMSCLTTASAFLCLLFLESHALQDLGVFAAISVVGAAIFALLLIPQTYKTVKLPSKPTPLDRLASYQFHKSKVAIGVVVIMAIISVFTYGKVVFNKDLTKLNYESEVLINAREQLEKLTDISSKSIYLSTYGANLNTVLQQNDSLYSQLKILKEKDLVISFSSISGLIRSQENQFQKIRNWHKFWQQAVIDSTKQNLLTSSAEYGFKENTFNEFYQLLTKDFDPLHLQDYDLVKSFAMDDYIVEDENGFTITSLVKINEPYIETIRKKFENSTNTLLIDRQQVNETFLGNLKNDFNSLIGYSFLVVLLILFLFYQRFSLTLVTSIPIFLTWFLTVGIMGLFHIEFNIFNIIICSFIFGLGVDYSIFMTSALLTEYRTGERTLPTHKTSIILSVITTIAGVGVMIFAKHPVLYTVSLVSLIGILCAAFVAFTVQPLLFRLFIGGPNKRPISPRYFIHSVLSFGYFGLGGFLLSVYGLIVLKISPKSRYQQNIGFHKVVSKLMGSVLYTNPFVSKEIRNPQVETFKNPAILIANHTSFLDILAVGMLHPKIIFLVNDWVYNSPVFGSAAKLAGAYPVTKGMEEGESYLKEKIDQGFSIIVFPEGTRSTSNKIKRFHKGAFYLAEKFQLDILPILIHGNSEVLPKGSFIIRDGSITIKLLPRISFNDTKFGKNYTERSKKIGRYFKQEFNRLRSEIETKTYWKKTILLHYRYKGPSIFKAIKKDIEQQLTSYYKLLGRFSKTESIIHLSNDYGQLDLLLTLDSIDRRIHLFLQDEMNRTLLSNNFLTKNYSKISLYENPEAAFNTTATKLLVDWEYFNLEKLLVGYSQIETIILIKDAKKLNTTSLKANGYTVSEKSVGIVILSKNSNTSIKP